MTKKNGFTKKEIKKEIKEDMGFQLHRVHKLHNHEVWENHDNIPKDKVIVDKEFSNLFDDVEDYREDHILVNKEEYYKLKNQRL